MTLILASQSPRRKALLSQLGVSFETCPADIDETPLASETPEDYVVRMALEKAQVISEKFPDAWVLGSDTSVILNGSIMGKPEDETDALTMLSALSGHTHQVLTAVALVSQQEVKTKLVSTNVVFREIPLELAKAYWDSGEPADKAGSYGIQGMGGMLVRSIEGSYSSVVGLPLAETADLLMDIGIEGWW